MLVLIVSEESEEERERRGNTTFLKGKDKGKLSDLTQFQFSHLSKEGSHLPR